MTAGRGHLRDAGLFECYLAERSGEDVVAAMASHLARCAECADRYLALSRLLDDDRLDAEAEADAAFPAERLLSQRQQILARLGQAGRIARIISFPARAARRVAHPATHTLPRWAAAAAAGIFLGMGLHIAYENARTEPYAEITAQVASPPPAVAEPTAAPMDPDAFFSTLDAALVGPRDPELMPLDALTPLAREISMQVR